MSIFAPDRPRPVGESDDDQLDDARRRNSRLTGRLLWALAAAFFVFSVMQLGISPERISRAWERFAYIRGAFFPPTLGDDPIAVGQGAIESLQVAVLGTVFGILLSLILTVLAARNISPLGPLSFLVKAFAGLVRAVPALVWALLFIVAVGLGPVPGILALAVNSTGMLVKVYAEAIEEIPMGPIEALRATGASKLQVAVQGVLPAVMKTFIAWSVFRFDINIRYASVLGVVGAGGIGWQLVRAANMGRYDWALGVTGVIFVMVMSAELLSGWLKRRGESAAAKAVA